MSIIKDIWFHTNLDLNILASNIGLIQVEMDAENHWEWVTGYLENVQLDITRPIDSKSDIYEVRIFRLGESPIISGELHSLIVTRLIKLGISPIYIGIWNYLSGNDFEKNILSKII
ncbi:hypothetical protein [Leptospira andrefontaineae]|uniref:Uncharacterized protein n=1 Tax=Leptospira andrefontaineae TaxID=2484976 RepID=A0A4V3JGA6_9LEPT|nr:hypothetical protein [Leptospira andrefontaineae]TGK41522.1 hypothetical protein EHO65_08875 [Leptospira andrefontaineae]